MVKEVNFMLCIFYQLFLNKNTQTWTEFGGIILYEIVREGLTEEKVRGCLGDEVSELQGQHTQRSEGEPEASAAEADRKAVSG